MGLTSYDAAVLAHANNIHYWTLNGTVNDSQGTNHLSGGTPGSYTVGIDGDQAMTLNGSSHSIYTASTIDLTLTNGVTVIYFIKWEEYDLANTEIQFEFSGNITSNAGTFAMYSLGAMANDPLQIAVNGDVGINSANYNQTTFGWGNNWYHLAATYDFSQAANEVQLYLNGDVLTASSRPVTSNNTANFGNYLMYIGSRGGSSLFSNITVCKIALFNAALSAGDIKSLFQSSQLGLAQIEISSMALKSQHKLRVA